MVKEYRQHIFRRPKRATEIFLIRHGESEAYVEGKSFILKDGQSDPSLHPQGKLQAKAIAKKFKDHPLAAIYITPLRRTKQTADPLADTKNIIPKVVPELREIFLGDWDGGIYRRKLVNKDPLLIKMAKTHEWGEIPGAETTKNFHLRVYKGLVKIARSHPDEVIAAFVHGGVISAILSIATNAKPLAFINAANGSISKIVVNDDKIIVLSYNDTSHLD